MTLTRRSLIAAASSAALISPSAAHYPKGKQSAIILGKRGKPWLLQGAPSRVNMLSVAGAGSAFGSPWTLTAASLGSTTLGPDGATNAKKLVETSTNNNHSVYQTVTRNSFAQKFRHAVIAKAGERQRIIVGIGNGTAFGTSGAYAIFDLVGGQIGVAVTNYGTGFTASGATIKPVGRGFCLCSVDISVPAATTMFPVIAIDRGTGTAAQNSAYAGDNASGIYLWQANVLPAGAWSFKNKVFGDSFSSLGAVDTGNTGAAGFNWYLGQKWLNSTAYDHVNGSTATDAWRTCATQDGAQISVGAGGLTLASDTATYVQSGTKTFGNCLCSLHPNGSGRTFGGGFLKGVRLKADTSLAQTSFSSWPSDWSIDSRFLLGSATEYLELDFIETIPSGAGTVNNLFSAHDWTISTGNISDNHVDLAATLSNADNQPHYYDTLWLTAAQNDGTNGLLMRFFDGVFIPSTDVKYSSGAVSVPAALPSNPSGVLSIVESAQFALFMGCGPNWPATFSDTYVYQ